MLSHYVLPQKIPLVWPIILPTLEAVLELDPDEETTEQVRWHLDKGLYTLFVMQPESGEVTGFWIATKAGDTLHIKYVFHRDPGVTVADYWPDAVEFAQAIGCTRIETWSRRPLHKALPVQPVTTLYRFEVPHVGRRQYQHQN